MEPKEPSVTSAKDEIEYGRMLDKISEFVKLLKDKKLIYLEW